VTYLMDLSPCWYLDEDGSLGLVSVGWLSKEHDFARGCIPPEFRERLVALMGDTYCPSLFLGSHLCDFCAPVNAHPFDLSYPHGCANLLVPGPDVIYACPALIVHYIDAHGYQPPDAFVMAVLQCPTVASEMYFRRLLEINDAGWRSELEATARGVSSQAHNAQRALRRRSLGDGVPLMVEPRRPMSLFWKVALTLFVLLIVFRLVWVLMKEGI